MATYKTVRWDKNSLLLYTYIQPKAAEDKVVGLFQNAIKIQITAPASDDKANLHLIKWLAKACKVPKNAVSIETGDHSRYKLVRIQSPQLLPSWLHHWLPKETP
jgi:uncharacterized protein (TIGR00251 family)